MLYLLVIFLKKKIKTKFRRRNNSRTEYIKCELLLFIFISIYDTQYSKIEIQVLDEDKRMKTTYNESYVFKFEKLPRM